MKNDNIVDEYERSYFLMKLMKFLGLYYYNKARNLKETFFPAFVISSSRDVVITFLAQ